MKTRLILSGLLMFFFTLISRAQWSTDPSHPGIVCSSSGSKSVLQSFDDGNGGAFIFWLDARKDAGKGARDIYGQHYNADGVGQWEANGRQIIEHYSHITAFSVQRSLNGEIIIGWASVSQSANWNDTLSFQRLDNNGARVWASDLIMASAGTSPYSIIYVDGFNFTQDAGGYWVDIQVDYMGGSNGNRLSRFNSSGVLTGIFDGFTAGPQNGFGSSNIESARDAGNNVYLFYSSGNGSGASLFCSKFDISGNMLWGPVNVTTGTSGLSYQFLGIGDSNGITFTWISNSQIFARRLHDNGSPDWGGNPLPICTAGGDRNNLFWKKKDTNYYLVWNDSRPGLSPGSNSIFVQKFDTTGNIAWTADGSQVLNIGASLSNPGFDFADNNSLIVCFQQGADGYVAEKVLDNGSPIWGPNGYLITTNMYIPYYQEHIDLQLQNHFITTWIPFVGGSQIPVYVSEVPADPWAGVAQLQQDELRVYPNPATSQFTVSFPGIRGKAELSLFDMEGRIQYSLNLEELKTDVPVIVPSGQIPSGVYLLQLRTASQLLGRKLIIRKQAE